MRNRSIAVTLWLAACLPAFADDAPPKKTPWTVDDVVEQECTRDWALSPDGEFAIWLKQTADTEKDEQVSTLMLTELATGEHRELTVGTGHVELPAIRPDSLAVSFLSKREPPEGIETPKDKEAGPQIWLLDLRGGEAQPLTKIPFGVGHYAWVDDHTLVLTTRERRSRRELIDEEKKDDTEVVEATDLFEDTGHRLFRLDTEDEKLTRLNDDKGPVSSFAVSPDGRYLVAIHQQSPAFTAEADVPPKCLVHDLKENKLTEVFAEHKSKPARIVWRLDSNGFYAIYPHSSVDGEDSAPVMVVKEVSVPALDVQDVGLGWERGVTSLFVPLADGFIAGLSDGVRPKLSLFRREVGGYRSQAIEHDEKGSIFSLLKARDTDQVLYVTGSASVPDIVMSARLSGAKLDDADKLYQPNDGFDDKTIAKTRTIKFKGALDEEVEALVHEPHNYEPGKRYPLVVMTHGGPYGIDDDRFYNDWAYCPNLYAQRGAFILQVNYHGSSEYGLKFGESIKGRYYELEIKDIFAGIKALIDEGAVDANQMGLIGWSNGAILNIAALTLDHLYAPGYDYKFKACAPGAGDVNWSSDYGNCEFGAVFDNFYLGGPPWKLTDVYQKKSPLFYVERVTTPTIIFFGTEDRAVPTEQGWQWYRALHMTKKAPVKFLLFPDQPHGLEKLSHQRRKLEEELAWFDRYLFGKDEKLQSTLKEGSRLDVALKKRDFPAQAGALGVQAGGRLVPEVVPFGEIEVGRFEVTRAQWQQFKSDFQVPEDARNHPVTGIDKQQAEAYVAWLKETTKEPWRLLREDEFKELEDSAGDEENTLDWWAGYEPSPEDAQSLREKLLQLPPLEVLLPVGSRPPGLYQRGDDKIPLFDIGGNAAELVLTDEDEAKIMGGCAVLETDDRAAKIAPPPEFIGFRVAKGDEPKSDADEDEAGANSD